VSCYALLSRFRLPWSLPDCLYECTPFVVSGKRFVRYFNRTFGSARIANPAYQERPTWSPLIAAQGRKGAVKTPREIQPRLSTHLKFESKLRGPAPKYCLSFALPDRNLLWNSSYPEGNFGRNQLLGDSMSLSPLCSILTNDLHVSTASGFQRAFARLHPDQA